jgi:urea transporter/murein DD-endopeptidase MepM/ murein hydrolase activator NlpD
MKQHLKTVLGSYAEIFFLHGALTGLLIFAVLIVAPNVALAGILAVLSAYAFACLIGLGQQFLQSGYYTYNPLLVGLSLGHLFQLTPLTACFIISAGVFTLLVTIFLENVFSTYLRLPILSVPFVIVSSMAYLASLKYSNLLVTSTPAALHADSMGLPFWIAGYFKSLGAILFAPSVIVGAVFAALILVASRILFALSLLGYFIGAGARGFLLGSASTAFGDANNFNFILIAMALGGVFLIPSPISYLLAAIAVATSTMFLDAMTGFWSFHGIPVFTLPFNLICLGMIYVLGLVNHPRVALVVGRTPEETLGSFHSNRLRYPGTQRTLFLPFSGPWTVWQGFDGRWTHKGSWRYAYDFVITDDEGETCTNEGKRLEDYYCYNKPVLAPVRGRVVQATDDLPDSPIGEPDKANNWGNLVILHDPRGFFVELSHFAAKSLRVKVGEWVERGTVLGLCGNSGYSPQPHIHIQVQANDVIGAGTMPFSFVSFANDCGYHANDLPIEGHRVEPLYPDKQLDRATNFSLDDELEYQITNNNSMTGKLRMKVKMAVDGTFYFESDKGQLYFSKHEGTFYFHRCTGADPFLKMLYLALPRLPLAPREAMHWKDYVPAELVASWPARIGLGFLASIYPKLAVTTVSMRFAGRQVIESEITQTLLTSASKKATIQFDDQKGFASVTVNNLKLTRINL